MSGSVGAVHTKKVTFDEPFKFERGGILPSLTIAYETYGRLNETRSNGILICHALTGDAHAAGVHDGDNRSGWWDKLIGPGKAFDTDRYFVICSNVIGGCKGSTGPSAKDPSTGKKYGLSFPEMTIGDMVRAEKRLINYLGIEKLAAVAGGSMGGMQALQWGVSFPESVRKVIAIATTARSSPQQIAFNEVGRQAIIADPLWNHGEYTDDKPPAKGLSLARMIGHITYLSDDSMQEKFGRDLREEPGTGYHPSAEFQVESYLHYQGDKFTRRFDANSYLYITRALDLFDLSIDGSLEAGFSGVKASFLIISVSSDWLYPPYQSEEIVRALSANDADVRYCEIQSKYGHDAFLLESGQMTYLIGSFLDQLYVKDVMTTNIPVISRESSVNDAAGIMMDKAVNHIPVLDKDGRIAGIVTTWDIAKAVACRYSDLGEIMTTNVITASPEDSVSDAARKMEESNISALPVVDENLRIKGLITSESISILVGRCR
jgi:homoserine O-acetyltransferase